MDSACLENILKHFGTDMKTLRRNVIIRESDLLSLLKKTIKKKLYDVAEIESMTYQGILNDNLVDALKGKENPKHRTLPDLYEQMLWREKNLFNRNYLNWKFTMDYPAGQIYVQSKLNQPREPLFNVVFEREY